jgi:hypothetical protein
VELEEASASKKAMDTQALADDAQRYLRANIHTYFIPIHNSVYFNFIPVINSFL